MPNAFCHSIRFSFDSEINTKIRSSRFNSKLVKPDDVNSHPIRSVKASFGLGESELKSVTLEFLCSRRLNKNTLLVTPQ